jgi:hypothetical protein
LIASSSHRRVIDIAYILLYGTVRRGVKAASMQRERAAEQRVVEDAVKKIARSITGKTCVTMSAVTKHDDVFAADQLIV